MKKLSIVALLALLCSIFAVTPAAAQSTITVRLSAQNNSGQTGMVTLTDAGNGQTTVTIDMTPGPAGVAQPAHIHEGTCANLNPAPAYPLSSVVDGKSTTTVNVSLGALMAGQAYAINIHKSGPEASVYVACGDILETVPAAGEMTMVTMNAQNGSGQSGMAHLTATADGKTMVMIDIVGGAAGVSQPAHIHKGTCANLDPAPAYPLTSVVDGKSTTTVDVALASLMAGQQYAINVHKSGPEASVYVSCGDIMSTGTAPAPTSPGMSAMTMVTMNAQNGSGQSGMAHLTATADGKTMVMIDIVGGASGVAQPAHIHKGTCANLDPAPAYPLTNVVDGKSTSTVNVALADLQGGQRYAINVHKSGPEASVYVSCGDIMALSGGTTAPAPAATPVASAPGMPRTGNSETTLFIGLGLLMILFILGSGIMLRRRA